MSVEDDVHAHDLRITKLEVEVDDVKKAVGTVCNDFKEFTKTGGVFEQMQASINKASASGDTLLTLVKWVIVPLITIVGLLSGIKLAWPTG